jgi:hypothetical protein
MTLPPLLPSFGRAPGGLSAILGMAFQAVKKKVK